MAPFTEVRQPRLTATMIIAALMPATGFAQQVFSPHEVTEGGIISADSYAILSEQAEEPDGSPTALRLNPLSDTSTSIRTMYPAAVLPLTERQGQTVEREETSIEGQCDPAVDCPATARAAGAISAGG